MNKKFTLLILGVCFFGMITMAAQCEHLTQPPIAPSDPLVSRIVSVGDSITQGVMSGDANFSTQPYAYPYLLAKQANTEMAMPSMVVDDPTATTPLYRRTVPGLFAHNLGVSGMDVTLSGTTKSVAGWKRTTTPPASFTDFSFKFTDEADAVLSPWSSGTNVLDAATALKPTLITFWLGNNDTLGSVANTSAKSTYEGYQKKFGFANLAAAQQFSTIVENGMNYQTNFVNTLPSPALKAAATAGQLDDADARKLSIAPASLGPYRPLNRMATATAFNTAYKSALTTLLKNTTAKIVVMNLPDVATIGHLFSFDEAKKFFIRYGAATQANLDSVWGTTGFGGDATAKIPLGVILYGLNAFKGVKAGGAGETIALGIVCKGKAIGGTNVAFFDWDVNNLTGAEIAVLSQRVTDINAEIDKVITALDTTYPGRITKVDIHKLFNDLVTSGRELNVRSGNPITTLPKLSRVYPGAGDNNSTNGKLTNGGIFSLDGVHPGPTAHAIIANEIIYAVNTKFGLSLPFIDEYAVWAKDPFVDHDKDGYIVGLSFTLNSTAIGSTTISRDKNDMDANTGP